MPPIDTMDAVYMPVERDGSSLHPAETPLRGDTLRLDSEECRSRMPEVPPLEFTEANKHM